MCGRAEERVDEQLLSGKFLQSLWLPGQMLADWDETAVPSFLSHTGSRANHQTARLRLNRDITTMMRRDAPHDLSFDTFDTFDTNTTATGWRRLH